MPIPKFATLPSPRTSGLVPPDVDLAGVTELRVHGVGGTSPESLLGDLAPQQVAGDATAGFFRTADHDGRHVEAYSWGGLTSRSSWRVLWLLLLPFLLANLAGWMGSRRVPRHGQLGWWHRYSVRLASLALSVNLVVLAAMGSMDVIAYQCGGQPGCVGGRWWLAPLRWSAVEARPGRRLVLGALIPAVVIVGLALLSYRSRNRYERVPPPARTGATRQDHVGAAALRDGLINPDFWDGEPATRRLSRLHVAVMLSVVTLLLSHLTHTFDQVTGTSPNSEWLWLASWLAAVLILAGAVTLLAMESAAERLTFALMWAGAIAAVGAAIFAWVQPAARSGLGQVPGLRNSVNITYGGVFGMLAFVLGVVLVDHWWLSRREVTRVGPDGRRRVRDREPTFRSGAPFVVLAISVVLLNAFLLGVLIWTAAFVGDITWETGTGTQPIEPGDQSIFVFPEIATAAPFLTLVPIAIVLIFSAVQVARWLRSGRKTLAKRIADEYGALEDDSEPVAEALKEWYVSATKLPKVPPPTPTRLDQEIAKRAKAWQSRVVRARWIASAGKDLQYLMTAVVAIGVVILMYEEWRIWVQKAPPPSDLFVAVGVVVATALPLALVGLLRLGWRDLSKRRQIGVLWDVGTFWPRSYHPLAPPSYAERAVPDLQRRMWWLHDNGGQLVLAAHSQGSVLAAAALIQPECRADKDVIALVTFGSPLRKLYRWAFPGYFTDQLLDYLADPASNARVERWENFYYQTDYIGGAVLDDDGGAKVDTCLPDPATSRYIYGQPTPAVGAHSGYWQDGRMWQRIDEIAGHLAEPQESAPARPGHAGRSFEDYERTRMWPPPGWSKHEYQHQRRSHVYYVVDREGRTSESRPRILLLHELAGISPSLRQFADELTSDFRVFVPSLLGRDGDPSLTAAVVQLCVRREIHLFATGASSPAIGWLRSFADDVVVHGSQPYGVIGMCMTGGFALALSIDPRVRAAVVAQPALPLSRLARHLPLRRYTARARDLGISQPDRDQLCARITEQPEALTVRALRYRDDWKSPPQRLEELTQLLGGPPRIETFILDGPNAAAHSTLTGPRRNPKAIHDLKAYLCERLTATD